MKDLKDIEVFVTTKDNPYNPFDDFDLWYEVDIQKNYNTCALLARLLPENIDFLSDKEINDKANEVINNIVANDLTNNYVKITKQK